MGHAIETKTTRKTTIQRELEAYKGWCNKHHLKPSNYTNLFLYTHKQDMGFIHDTLSDYKHQLTDNQISAVMD